MSLAEASALFSRGRLAEAEARCRSAAAGRPMDPGPLHLLGTILHKKGRVGEALELMRRAVALAPGSVPLRVNLAALLGQAGRLEDALAELRQAVRLGGVIPELHNNLAVTLEKLNRPGEAEPAYRRAIALRPGYVEAHANLGNALRKLGRVAEAATQYRRALALDPSYARALDGLGASSAQLGDGPGAVVQYRRMVAADPTSPAARSALLYTLHYCPEYDAETLAREHREWGRLFCDPLKGSIAPHENDPDPDRRLRVGYVSPDLREHTVTKFISAAIQHHDRERFEVTGYSDAERPDPVTERIRGWCERWRETRGMNTGAMEKLIREDQIDLLVDLRGHAADNRLVLFARKPAPVQVNMVGYFDTTGLSAMDHRLTDRHMDPLRQAQGGPVRQAQGEPPGTSEHLNTERLIRIEPSCWCYSPEPEAPAVSGPPALKTGHVTFGSLNKGVKISEPCAGLWARVLDAVPGSKLLLSAAGDASAAVRERLAGLGLPSDQLILLDKTVTSREYLERFHEIDIALDTFPFGGITTTCDGLWMGVPCVSLSGGTSVSRAGHSILHAANLPELAIDSPERFVQVASDLARDVDRLRSMRLDMRERLRASALMDHGGFGRKLEAEYRRAWRDWCSRARTAEPMST